MAFFSLCFYSPRTGSFLRSGPIHVVWNRKPTYTHSFVFSAFSPFFHRVSIIALITTNKREQPEEAVSPVYTSICTSVGQIAQAKYLVILKRGRLNISLAIMKTSAL